MLGIPMDTAQEPEELPAQPRGTEQHADAGEPVDAVRTRVTGAGASARRLRRVLALLTEDFRTLEELVRIPAVPRRTVEELLSLAGEDVETDGDTYRLAPSARDRYRDRLDLDTLDEPTDTGGLLERLRAFVDAGPTPSTALDHVTATPETVLARATWLRETYDLTGRHLVLLGDHDLTSLAACLVEPSLRATVVDVDERILAHIDQLANENGLDVHTLHADLRFGLPPAAADADFVFTDPPYTPEGIGLFAARAGECLSGPHGRLLLAYGFSDRSPALGHKVQQELLRLGMVFEAILPAFHRYHGAQAIGSASDLYVCRPGLQTRKLAGRQATAIYTHGGQSVESAQQEPGEEFLATLSALTGTTVRQLRQPGWDRPLRATPPPVFDLRADPGPWLLRMLLACNADHAAFVVGNRHPDITSEHAQHALVELVRAKFSLRFHRSSPDATHAVVLAGPPESSGGVAAHLLNRAHGKIGNTWREALIHRATAAGTTLSKRDAAERVAALVQHSGDLDTRLVDLPRHRISTLLHSEP